MGARNTSGGCGQQFGAKGSFCRVFEVFSRELLRAIWSACRKRLAGLRLRMGGLWTTIGENPKACETGLRGVRRGERSAVAERRRTRSYPAMGGVRRRVCERGQARRLHHKRGA